MSRRLLLIVAVVLAGCGGAADERGAPTSALSSTTAVVRVAAANPTSSPAAATSIVPGGSSTSAQPSARVACPVRPVRSGAPVVVTLWHQLPSSAARALDEMLTALAPSLPGVTVDVVSGRSRTDYETAAPADRPDIGIFDAADLAPLVDAGVVAPVGPCSADAGVARPALLPLLEARYGAGADATAQPFQPSVPVLVYNRDRFAAAGLDPLRPPTTLADLETVAARIVAAGAASVGVAMDSGQAVWVLEQWRLARGLDVYDRADGWEGAPERTTIADAVSVADLELLQRMLASGSLSIVQPSAFGMDTLLALVDPDRPAAMAFASSGTLAEVRQAAAAAGLADRIGVSLLPGPAVGSVPGGSVAYLSAASPPDRMAAALGVLAGLLSPEAQGLLSSVSSGPPVIAGAADVGAIVDAWSASPERRLAYDALAGPLTNPRLRGTLVGPYADVRAVQRAVLESLSGADPASSLDAAAATIDGVLAAYAASAGGRR